MKVSNAIYRALVCLVVVLGTLSSCITLRPATVVGSKDFGGYKYVYIPPTQAVYGSATQGTAESNSHYNQFVNPRDIIAGMMAKRGYIILHDLDDKFRHQAIIVNYGVSDGRQVILTDIATDVTLQFVSADTGELICSTTAEGFGAKTQAENIKQALNRALEALLR